ncbi:hypothetical protein AB0M20_32465, partial [Actinoplanes sp. NPDC051633]
GAGVQPAVPWIGRVTRGRQAVAGMLVFLTGTLLLAAVAVSHSPLLAVAGAAVLGAAYGICIVSGLVEVQAMAPPQDLAGLTGLYWSITYAGFALPVLLAWPAPAVGYPVLLLIVAAVVLSCTAVVVATLHRAYSAAREPFAGK